MVPAEAVVEPFGNPAPFAEPAWYNCLASPYYKESHRRVREYVRKYLDEHIAPYAEEWEAQGHVPDDTKRRYAQAGLAFQEMPAEYSGGVQLPGGVPADGKVPPSELAHQTLTPSPRMGHFPPSCTEL